MEERHLTTRTIVCGSISRRLGRTRNRVEDHMMVLSVKPILLIRYVFWAYLMQLCDRLKL